MSTTTEQPPPADDGDGDSDDEQGGVVNTDETVHEAMAALHTISDEVTISSLPTDEAERELISHFWTSGCGCNKVSGKPCRSQFSLEYLTFVRESCLELSHSELDMAIMGQLVAGMNTSSTVSAVS